MNLQQQLSVVIAGLITFHGADANIIAFVVIAAVLLINHKKVQEHEPCKVYDFMAYKEKRDAEKQRANVAFKKAA